MEKGTLLLASSGKEFIKPTGILSNSSEVKKARKEAMGRLGLDFLESVGGTDEMDIDKELAADEVDQDVEMMDTTVKLEEGAVFSPKTEGTPDTIMKKEPSPPARSSSATPAAQSPVAPGSAADESVLSARERNRLKRKRKPGNHAFVAAPIPTQGTGAKFNIAAAGNKYGYFHVLTSDIV